MVELGQLGYVQLIDRKNEASTKQKGQGYLSEFRSLNNRISKLIKVLEISQKSQSNNEEIDFDIKDLDKIQKEYSERISIIEKEISDIEEIKIIIERDLAEIIEKENEYKKVTNSKGDETKISLLVDEKTKFESDLKELGKKYYDEILMYKNVLSFLVPYLDATQNITQTKLFSILSCWAISKKIPELENKIQKITSKKFIIFKETPSIKKKFEKGGNPPTVMQHSRILEPFVRLVKLYGIPNYYEFDPTIMISITFPLFFGLMFGDVGQGLALMIGSAIIALITKRTIPKILFYCGIGSIFAGFLYGEFFGFYLPQIWPGFQPLLGFPNQGFYLDIFSTGIGHYEGVIDNIPYMLRIAILIGYIQISSGFIIQFSNYYKTEKKAEAWLITVPSLFILTGMIIILNFFGFNIGHYISPSPYLLGLPPIFLVIIPLIFLLIGGPIYSIIKKSRKIKEIMGEAALRTWEVGLSIITNLPSYARIFALIMIHFGLNEAFQAIGESFNDILLFGIIVGIGNAFTVLLEVVIVSAHALRLHFYEWFSKFYEGNGIEFKPFRLPKNSKLFI